MSKTKFRRQGWHKGHAQVVTCRVGRQSEWGCLNGVWKYMASSCLRSLQDDGISSLPWGRAPLSCPAMERTVHYEWRTFARTYTYAQMFSIRSEQSVPLQGTTGGLVLREEMRYHHPAMNEGKRTPCTSTRHLGTLTRFAVLLCTWLLARDPYVSLVVGTWF